MSRLNIAFVIDDLGFGGAQRQLCVLVQALSHSHQPHVFCLSQSTRPFAGRIRSAGVGVDVLPRSHGFDLRRLNHLTRAVKKRRVDVVHGFLDAANVYSWVAARRAGVPCVLSLRNERLRLTGFRRWALSRALRSADCVVANSKAGGRFLIEGLHLPQQRVTVVPNAISVPPSSPSPPAPTPPVIGFVGRLDPQKQVDLVIDAFALSLAALPDATLVVVGAGPQHQDLVDRVRRHGIENRVQFTGLVEDVEQHMARFSCLALPSAYEGFPNVAMEAVALGVPVVAAPVGDVEDIVLDGRTGYLMRDRSPHALAELLVRASASGDLRRRAGEVGPALIRTNYSVEAAVERLLRVYDSVTAT